MGDEEAARIAEAMSAFSTSSRVAILYLLHATEHTVEELAAASGLSAGAVSQQLRVLRLHGLVVARRDGRHMRYRLADDHVADLLVAMRAHSDHVGAGGLTADFGTSATA